MQTSIVEYKCDYCNFTSDDRSETIKHENKCRIKNDPIAQYEQNRRKAVQGIINSESCNELEDRVNSYTKKFLDKDINFSVVSLERGHIPNLEKLRISHTSCTSSRKLFQSLTGVSTTGNYLMVYRFPNIQAKYTEYLTVEKELSKDASTQRKYKIEEKKKWIESYPRAKDIENYDIEIQKLRDSIEVFEKRKQELIDIRNFKFEEQFIPLSYSKEMEKAKQLKYDLRL